MNHIANSKSPCRIIIFTAITLGFVLTASLPALATNAFITNAGSNSVSVVQTDTNQVIATIPVAITPSNIAISPDGALAYVTGAQTVSIIDLKAVFNPLIPTTKAVATVPVSTSQNGATVSPDGRLVYMTTSDGTSTLVSGRFLNTFDTLPVGSSSGGIAVSADGLSLYLTSVNSLLVFNTRSRKMVKVPVGTRPSGLALSTRRNAVYVTNAGSNDVWVINALDNAVIARVPVGAGPSAVATTPDGAIAYVANAGDNTVSVINALDNTVVATVPVGTRPSAVATTPDGGLAYVTNAGSNNVSVIDRDTNKVVTTVTVGAAPSGVATSYAQVTTHFGSAVVTDGKFTNVYVFPDPDKETWEQHMASLDPKLRRSDADQFSRAAIDGFADQLMASGWPSYFDGLLQYGVVHAPQFFGSAVASQACVDAAMKDRYNGVLQWDTIRSLANCHVSGMDPSPQVNLIFSPDIPIASIQGPLIHGVDMCTESPATTAWHAWGLNTPNLAAIPTSKLCMSNFVSFTQAVTHEVVEMLSDPAGFGVGLFGSNELGDICQNRKPPELTTYKGFSLERYWSDFENNCQPRLDPPAGSVAETWVLGQGPPLMRFSRDVHELTLDVPADRAITSAPATRVQLVIQTGAEDSQAPAAGDPDDTVVATLHFAGGSTIRDVLSNRLSCAQPCLSSQPVWWNGQTHSVQFALPSVPPRVSDITGVTISTSFRGGFRWNVDKVALVVSFPAASPTQAPLQRTVVHTWLNASGAPLVRFTGNVHDHREIVQVDAQDLGASIRALDLIISTGNDDLRGGSSPGDNGDVTVELASGKTIQVNNVNAGQTWSGWSINTVSIPLPADGLKAGDLKAVSLHTGFGGGIGGDNWNVNRIQLKATLVIPRPTVDAVVPNSTPCTASLPVTITGANFYDVQRVLLDSLDLNFTVNSNTQITASIPNSVSPGVHVITVNTPEGSSIGSSPRSNLFFVAPTVTSISPTSGPVTGGTGVKVNGTCFDMAASGMDFFFGDSKAPFYACTSSTQCFVLSPSAVSANHVDVRASRGGALSQATATDQFRYSSNPVPVEFQLPNTFFGIQSATVSLNGVAPKGGTRITLTSSDSNAVRVQGTALIPEGSTSISTQFEFAPVTITEDVILTAASADGSATATAHLLPWRPVKILADLPGLQSIPLQVFVNPVAAAGASVSLTSSDALLLPVPPSVLIPAGAYWAEFTIPLPDGSPTESVIISATYNGASDSTSIQLICTLPATSKRKCPKGFYWNDQDCQCERGMPQ